MIWELPNILFLLWLLPVAGWLILRAQQKRRAAALAFADSAMTARLMPALGGPRPWLKGGALLLGLAGLIVAGARPRFGEYYEKVSQRGVDLFVLIDVSRSMLAQDVAPNRLERAKADVRDLLARLAGDRVGLIAFAGKAVVKVPLTTDHGFFLQALEELDPTSAPRGGSLIGDAIRKAMESMEPRNDRERVLVLITDGEDHDSYPAEAARQAAEQGIRIFAVGLGDPNEGARVPTRDDAGHLGFLKYEGAEVWSKMDEKLLEQIALTTQGAYIPAKTRAYDLGEVYADHLAHLTQGEIQAEKRKRFRDRFQIFLALGIGFLALGRLIPPYPRKDEVVP